MVYHRSEATDPRRSSSRDDDHRFREDDERRRRGRSGSRDDSGSSSGLTRERYSRSSSGRDASGSRDRREAGQDYLNDSRGVAGHSGDGFTSEKEKAATNVFQNDGSFLEMFKKMQEAQKPVKEEVESSEDVPAELLPTVHAQPVVKRPLNAMVGKRRGGRVLPTGMVKKLKREEDDQKPKDAWSLYMAEVRKYKEASCEEEGKTRPLVK